MAKFVAAGVVDPLEWTFEPHVQAHGVISEPTDDQIADFFKEIRKITAEARKHVEATGKAVDDLADADDPSEAIAALDDTEVVLGMHQRLAQVYADLCSGDPSQEQILKLPMRIRTIFYAWLQREVMTPEAVPAAGNSQVTTLRSAAGG